LPLTTNETRQMMVSSPECNRLLEMTSNSPFSSQAPVEKRVTLDAHVCCAVTGRPCSLNVFIELSLLQMSNIFATSAVGHVQSWTTPVPQTHVSHALWH